MSVILTVDTVLLTLSKGELKVALFRRERNPFQGLWALPGGYVREDEDANAQAAAARVLAEKAAVQSPYLEEFGTRSGPARDPRGWSLTVIYYALVPSNLLPEELGLFPVDKLPPLPFDHAEVISSVVARVRSKSGYSSLPAFLCPPEFTIPELRATYEAVLGEPLNDASFRRKLEEWALLEAVPGALRTAGRNRPSQLYRLAAPYREKLSLRDRVL